jgi:5,6-dimethylbenzimidazole synthase
MNIEEFLALVKARRSFRKMKPDPLPQGAVEQILEAGRWAMSGANAQPWEFIVVTEPDTKLKLAEAHLATRDEQHVIELTRIPELRHNVGRSEPGLPPWKDAPVVIVVLGDRRTVQASVLSTAFIPSEGGPDAIYLKDIANATQIMHLAAVACGLGSHNVSVSHTMEQLIKPVLNVPEVLDIHTLFVAGYPAAPARVAYRRELKEFVHYGKYDRSKFRPGSEILKYIAELKQKSLNTPPLKKV